MINFELFEIDHKNLSLHQKAFYLNFPSTFSDNCIEMHINLLNKIEIIKYEP